MQKYTSFLLSGIRAERIKIGSYLSSSNIEVRRPTKVSSYFLRAIDKRPEINLYV